MIAARVVHTAHVAAAELSAIRRLVELAFAGRFDDADWGHALGGLHILAAEDDQVIAHAAVVQRQLGYDGQPIRTGYVEAVAVHPRWQGRGYAAMIMDEAERIIRAAYDLGALSASSGVEGFYVSRGWLAWRGPTFVLAPDGLTRTPDDDDSTYVLPGSAGISLDLTGALVCDWRDGDAW